jgi:hypothetical protein
MAHGHETRIQELERRYGIMGNDLRSLRQRATAVGEGIRGVWIDGLGVSPVATPPCVTYYNGTLRGLLSVAGVLQPLAGCGFQVRGHQTGNDYGTYAWPTAAFNFGIYQNTTDTSLEFAVSGPGVRWLSPAAFVTLPGGGFCQTNTNIYTTLGPQMAAGYGNSGLCNFPVEASLSLTDSRFGGPPSIDLTAPGGSTWTGDDGTTFWTAFGGTLSTGNGVGIAPTWAITSQTCPDAGATTFDITLTCTGAGWGYSVGDTIRIFE